jgi:hypothetical protein
MHSIAATSVSVCRIVLVLVAAARNLPAATISVTTIDDSGPGALRAALSSVGDGDALDFSLLLAATIRLTGGVPEK